MLRPRHGSPVGAAAYRSRPLAFVLERRLLDRGMLWSLDLAARSTANWRPPRLQNLHPGPAIFLADPRTAPSTDSGSADADQSPRIVSPVPDPLRLIAAMEEVGIVSVVCCARSRLGSNARRVGCGPSAIVIAIVIPGAIIRAWIGPAADPPRP